MENSSPFLLAELSRKSIACEREEAKKRRGARSESEKRAGTVGFTGVQTQGKVSEATGKEGQTENNDLAKDYFSYQATY